MTKHKPKKFKQRASNYNYKTRNGFGQRIKNFFSTDIENDLKEEEPTKKFEKIKLFTLTKGWLFLSILVFMLLINILVGFNINFLYLKQILGFLFLILIPGLLIMLCFKIRTVKFWEYLVYTVGLSLAFIMFAGLAVNSIGIALQNNNEAGNLFEGDYSLYNGFYIEETELPTAVQNIWVGKNDTLYGYYSDKIVKSTDNGTTWNAIYEFTEGEGNRRVWVDSRGTIFAGRDSTGKVYMSSGEDTNWVITLDFVCEAGGTLWNLDEDNLGNLYVGEYGGDTAENCAYIHKSSDGGLTWSIVYNSSTYGWDARHVHTVKVDKKTDYIYAATGDYYEAARLIRSTDHGKTWTTLQSETSEDWSDGVDAQYITMVFFSDHKLFGTDAHKPNKIIRTSDDSTFSDSAVFTGIEDGYIWTASKNIDGITFIGTLSETARNHAGLYVTTDEGDSWYRIKDLGETNSSYKGINHISNFDSKGYAYYYDNVNDKTYRFTYDSEAINSNDKKHEFWNIFKTPLSRYPIIICFNIFLIALGIIAWRRNKDLEHEFTTPKLDAQNNIFFIIPMIFPILSILGAFLLNNHGPNILTMIMLGGIAIYILLLIIFRKKLNENIWPWAILMMSLALLLSFSMRSWFISGWDINQETYVFRLTIEKGIWSMKNYSDAYNACLSLSILPTIIKIFTSLNTQIIFKFIFQIIFAFNALTIFLIFRRYISPVLAFIASFLYFGASYFSAGLTTLMRQEIAFLFFGLMLLVLFSKEISPILKKILFLIFGFSMIVSHYSTAYIALAIFLFTYLCIFFYKRHEKRKIKKGKLNKSERKEFYLTGLIILFLLIFAFLWFSGITKTSSGVISTIGTTYENIGNTFNWDLKQSSVKSALFGNSNIKGYTNQELNDYINETNFLLKKQDPYYSYTEQQTQIYSPKVVGKDIIYPNNYNFSYFSSYLYKFIKYLIILSFILGSLFICLNRKKIADKEFSFMIIISVIFVILMVLLPYISKAYNFERLFQQCLVFLSFSSIIFFQRLFKGYKKIFLFFVVLIYLGYFLFNIGFLLAYSGGNPTLNLYNSGFTYDALYPHNEETISINWFNENYKESIVYMDPYSNLKFYSFGDPTISKDTKIIPLFMNKYSYVYSNFANKIKGVNYLDAREKFNNGVLSFNFPTEFINDNKNKVYNNGGSEIFK